MDSEKKVDMRDLIEKGKSKGSLSNNDIMEAIDFTEYDIDQLEKLYETLESNGIEVTNYINTAEFDDVEAEAARWITARKLTRCLLRRVWLLTIRSVCI